jgi:hypothetical protein
MCSTVSHQLDWFSSFPRIRIMGTSFGTPPPVNDETESVLPNKSE